MQNSLLALKIALLFCLCLLSARAAALINASIHAIDDSRALIHKIDLTATEVLSYVQLQSETLRSPKNQKAIEAGIQAAAALKGTAQLLNRQVLPRSMKLLDSLDESARAFGSLVHNTDASMNHGLLPELTKTARALGVTVEELATAIQATSSESKLTLEEARKIIASPEWLQILRHLESTASHIDRVSEDAANATQRLPIIADALEKFAKTGVRYQKPILLLRALAIALGIFY